MTNDKALKLARETLEPIIDDCFLKRGDWGEYVIAFAAAIEAESSKELAAAQAEIVRLRECLSKLCSYTSACEGMLNVYPAGQVVAAEEILSVPPSTQALDQAIAQAVEPYKRDAALGAALRPNYDAAKKYDVDHIHWRISEIDEAIRAREEE